ncbi:MAG: mannose-1-phosphate guanylyltransferase [Rhodospirillaceae bacterium]|nr:mannose-1-phosphate guanylyltransferase [Rhodospirillaceae bacterium]
MVIREKPNSFGFVPDRAMVLAAGLGLRMRPLTQNLPKPLLEVGGATMLDHALDRFDDVGVSEVVVNTHWLAKKIHAHLERRTTPSIVISSEEELLETGGGIAKALPHLGDAPFYVANADIVWRGGPTPALVRLADAWKDDEMDALLLLTSTIRATGYVGDGDFMMDPVGLLERRPDRFIAPYVFTGVQIVHPRLFVDIPEGAFSINLLYERALEAGRLFGIAHDGDWYHVGTPQAIDQADSEILEREGSRVRMLF